MFMVSSSFRPGPIKNRSIFDQRGFAPIRGRPRLIVIYWDDFAVRPNFNGDAVRSRWHREVPGMRLPDRLPHRFGKSLGEFAAYRVIAQGRFDFIARHTVSSIVPGRSPGRFRITGSFNGLWIR
jgi:hypothetical protein